MSAMCLCVCVGVSQCVRVHVEKLRSDVFNYPTPYLFIETVSLILKLTDLSRLSSKVQALSVSTPGQCLFTSLQLGTGDQNPVFMFTGPALYLIPSPQERPLK